MVQFQDKLYIGTNEGTIIGFDKKQETVLFRLQTKDLFGIDYPVDKLHCASRWPPLYLPLR